MEQWRSVSVGTDRLATWLTGFAQRHGPPQATLASGALHMLAPDGAEAILSSRWPLALPNDANDPVSTFVTAATLPRRVGILLVRRERHAVGIAEGTTVTSARVGRHYVQGRTKAGGWSQQRYARRRENQANQAYEKAAADVVDLLEPEAASLEGIITGGDARGLEAVLSDSRLKRVDALTRRVPLPRLEVNDPTRAALVEFAARYAAITVRLNPLA
ncbi:MAG TPA: acVLRF1 family peptidyl-tRNA hydrolase [Propionibacteriaceae bacterium]|nr:acVLRF1 family peptidyl-tRNA hydrolase [Propionibacteriaceae bacterium]